MDIEITYANNEGEITKRNIKNIWEIQDNGKNELVLVEHDHLCERFNFKDIKELKVYRGWYGYFKYSKYIIWI